MNTDNITTLDKLIKDHNESTVPHVKQPYVEDEYPVTETVHPRTLSECVQALAEHNAETESVAHLCDEAELDERDNTRKELEALECTLTLVESTTYYFRENYAPVHEDDIAEYGEMDDVWPYMFQSDENDLLHYYLGEASKDEVDNLCHVLMLGTGGNHDFHHALYLVLSA